LANHNQNGNAREIGQTPWDIIGKNTTTSYFAARCGWTEVAGKDPVAMLKLIQAAQSHSHLIKASDGQGNPEGPIIGQESTDWQALITALPWVT